VRRRAATLAAALGAGMLLVLVASESEPARKAVAARAGLVGPALATAQRSLDRDDDGAPRLLGGGDCDDGDPAIHPGALDFPDDGLDEDCDGRDATVTVLEPPPFAPVPAAVPRDLNLLFVTIDTLRADHLGCYGYARPTSPVIDRLAAEGALFENGWAHAPSTRYSMPAIATGRWPSAIAWDESIWWPRIAPGVRTVGEALKAAGYHTGAIYSYDYFAPRDRRGFERGIDHYRADRAVLHQAVNGPMESRGSSSREVTDDAMAFVEAARQGKFFLWVHYYDPHLSYDPHPEVPPFGGSRVDRYDGEIRFTDLHLGRLLDRLRSLGLWERTAVILTGDHGEGFGEHGVNEHGFDLYAPQTKVPLVVRVPGLAPRRVRAPAGHVDLAPTMLNLARAAREPAFLGRSLLPELTGTATGPARPLFQEVSSERGKKRALVTERLHVIWNWTPENTTECYDLAADPEERRDLWGRRSAEGCTRLRHELGAMVSALSVPSGFGEQLARAVFPPGRALPALPVSVAASVGGVAKVLGYGPTGAGAVVAAGAPVEMSHLFESTRRIPPGWRFYFHLVGPDGSFQNLDHIPVGGAMPPERWRPGQRILDQHRFTVPSGMPPGRYQLVVGMFRGGERMKIEPRELSDGQDGLKTVSLDVR
jgi:arylsulfatase A-like enzyme